MSSDSYATEQLVKVIRVFERYVGPKPPHMSTPVWVNHCMSFLEKKVKRLEEERGE